MVDNIHTYRLDEVFQDQVGFVEGPSPLWARVMQDNLVDVPHYLWVIVDCCTYMFRNGGGVEAAKTVGLGEHSYEGGWCGVHCLDAEGNA